jgi:hypothetical protein
MTDDENAEGRLIALELMIQGFMTQVVMESGSEPSEFIKRWQDTMKLSLQNADRPIDERSDRVWECAIVALELLFSNVRKRTSAPDEKD